MSSIDYNWTTFNLKRAMAGVPVGIDKGLTLDPSLIPSVCGFLGHRSNGPAYYENEYDEQDALIHSSRVLCQYCVTISGHDIWCKADGTIVDCIPDDGFLGGATVLSMLSADIQQTYGPDQTITRSIDSEHSNQIAIAALEPRDQFAMEVLRTLISRLERPEGADDATILYICNASYRWANGMMSAAAEARAALANSGGASGTDTVTVNTNSFTSNLERVLYNIFATLKNTLNDGQNLGVRVSAAVSEMPDLTVETMPDLTIESMPDLTIDSMPDVTVGGIPDLTVEEMPTLSVEVTSMPAEEPSNQ